VLWGGRSERSLVGKSAGDDNEDMLARVGRKLISRQICKKDRRKPTLPKNWKITSHSTNCEPCSTAQEMLTWLIPLLHPSYLLLYQPPVTQDVYS